MSDRSKLLQSLGIPFAALASVIFGLMILSFPVGAYVVFNSTLETDIHFDYPLNPFNPIFSEIPRLEISVQLGDAFITVWTIFVIVFAIGLFGPKANFLSSLFPIISETKRELKSNYLVSSIKWFSILIVISAVIIFVQEGFGVKTESLDSSNILIQFYNVTLAPITEEIGFRVLLIGIPLFVMYSHNNSIRLFLKSLWHPAENLHIFKQKRVLVLITIVGIIFGAAHVISDEGWSFGKFTQATASGIIIGWVYFRYGFISAILVHWATNYFVFSYVYMIADINEISIQSAFTHSLTTTLEILFIITGIISIALILLNYVTLKKQKRLEI